MAMSDTGGGEKWSGTRLTLDLWHPNCWAIEATRQTDGGVLAHAIYNTPKADGDAPNSVNGLFTAFADTNEEVEELLDAIRASDRAGDLLELTLVNEDADSVGLNPYDWAVYRETDDGWKRVERGPVIEPWVVLEAGDRVRWRVGVGDADPDTSPEDVYGGSLALDSGRRYAFSVSVDVAGDRVSLVAPFTVE